MNEDDIMMDEDDIRVVPFDEEDPEEGSSRKDLPKLGLGPDDRFDDNNFTPAGMEKIMSYMERTYAGKLDINVNGLKRAVGCAWRTADHLRKEFVERRWQQQTSSSQSLVLGIDHFSGVAEDAAVHPKRYGLKNEKEVAMFQLFLFEKCLAWQEMLGPKPEFVKPKLNYKTLDPKLRRYLAEQKKAELAEVEAIIQEYDAEHPKELPKPAAVKPEAAEAPAPVEDTKRDESVTPPPPAQYKTDEEEPRHFTF